MKTKSFAILILVALVAANLAVPVWGQKSATPAEMRN